MLAPPPITTSGLFGPDPVRSSRDAADQIELATNRAILAVGHKFNPLADADGAREAIRRLQTVVDALPRQRTRDREQEQFQQFSTPPHLAYLVAWTANLRHDPVNPDRYLGERSDTVLEPSAGVGGIAVFSLIAGCVTFANELSDRRFRLLSVIQKDFPYLHLYSENADHLHSVLPPDVQPTVALMNPPFSQSAGRTGDRKAIGTGLRHVEQVLLRLQPAGRLVTILPAAMDGGTTDMTARWLGECEWAVRANIGFPREIYAKMGTSYPCRLVVVDKAAATGACPVVADGVDLVDAVGLLEVVRNLREYNHANATSADDAGDRIQRQVGSVGGEPAAGVGTTGDVHGRTKGRLAGQSGEGTRRPPARPADAVQVGTANLVEPTAEQCLAAVYESVTEETWDNSHGIGLDGPYRGKTLWQAILIEDPSFARVGPRYEGNIQTHGWPQLPSQEIVRRVLERSTNGTIKVAAAAASRGDADAVRSVEDSQRREAVGTRHRNRVKVLGNPTGGGTAVASGDASGDRAGMVRPGSDRPVADLVIRPIDPVATAPIADAVYEPYRMQRIEIVGAKPHPTPLVQSGALASVLPPPVTYTPKLPVGIVESGALSDAQLEAVVYAGQAFEDWLPEQEIDGKQVRCRKGYFVGDSTGVGKGRTACGVILDAFAHGCRRAMWFSASSKLIRDAIRDWVDLGQDENKFTSLAKIPPGEPIPHIEGRQILFGTYALLRSGSAPSVRDPLKKRIRITDLPGDYTGHPGEMIGRLFVNLCNGPTATTYSNASYYGIIQCGRFANQNIRDACYSVNPKFDPKNPDKRTIFLALGLPVEAGKPLEVDASKSRLNQVLTWAGEGFEGPVILDESHQARSSLEI